VRAYSKHRVDPGLLARDAGREALGVLIPGRANSCPALLLALAAAQLCIALDTPLPWMIGPLFSTAIACMLGARLAAPVQAREAGQWAIGTALGLYFSAPVLAALARNAAAGSRWRWPSRSASAWRAAGCCAACPAATTPPPSSRWPSAAPPRWRCRASATAPLVERVAAAHSLRIMMVVGTIPFAVRWWSAHGWGAGLDLFVPLAGRSTARPGLLVLIALTAGAALLLKRLRVPNAWVIGPLSWR
jgi:uncharacterized membrane protein AbrB (regulator of aidB expression)